MPLTGGEVVPLTGGEGSRAEAGERSAGWRAEQDLPGKLGFQCHEANLGLNGRSGSCPEEEGSVM